MRYMSATSTRGVLYKISVVFNESFQHTDPWTRLSDHLLDTRLIDHVYFGKKGVEHFKPK